MKQSHIISLLKSDDIDTPPRRKKWLFYPSEASCIIEGKVVGNCLRRSYYAWKKAPITDQPSIFARVSRKMGKFIETDTKDCLLHNRELVDKSKKDRHFKTEIIDEITVSGEIDAIMKRGNKEIGLEIKSFSSNPKYVAVEPKKTHIMQALLYIICYRPRVPYWIIFYRKSPVTYKAKMDDWINFEGFEHRIDWIKMDNNIFPIINGKLDKSISIRGILERWKVLKYYIIKNELPPCDYKLSSKECSYCPYKKQCKQDRFGKRR